MSGNFTQSKVNRGDYTASNLGTGFSMEHGGLVPLKPWTRKLVPKAVYRTRHTTGRAEINRKLMSITLTVASSWLKNNFRRDRHVYTHISIMFLDIESTVEWPDCFWTWFACQIVQNDFKSGMCDSTLHLDKQYQLEVAADEFLSSVQFDHHRVD